MRLLSWRAGFVLGLITFVFGVILAFRPTQSVAVFAVLVGVVMIVTGVYHIIRAIGAREQHRVWRGLAGVVCIVIGLALLRHLHLSVALVGLFVGFTWVIQGIAALVETFAGRGTRTETGWSVFFGFLSLIAGIIVIAAPIASVATLTIFLGAWFIVMGIMEMIGAWASRHEADRADSGDVNVPQQRAMTDEAAAREAGAGHGAAGHGTPGAGAPSERR